MQKRPIQWEPPFLLAHTFLMKHRLVCITADPKGCEPFRGSPSCPDPPPGTHVLTQPWLSAVQAPHAPASSHTQHASLSSTHSSTCTMPLGTRVWGTGCKFEVVRVQEIQIRPGDAVAVGPGKLVQEWTNGARTRGETDTRACQSCRRRQRSLLRAWTQG